MAKLAILISTLVALTFADIKYYKKDLQLPEDILNSWNKLIEPYVTECMCQTKVEPHFVKDFQKYGEFANDSCFKCFLKCLGLKVHAMKDNADLDQVRIPKMVAGATDEVTKECTARVDFEKDPCEKAYLFGKCLSAAVNAPGTNRF